MPALSSRRSAGRQIPAATGRPNSVLATDDASVLVGTTHLPDGELAPIKEVQDGIDRLAEAGEIEVHPSSLGYRRAVSLGTLWRCTATTRGIAGLAGLRSR